MKYSLIFLAAVLVSDCGLAHAQSYNRVDLVSNTSGTARAVDPHLINPWGLARNTSSDWRVANTGQGLVTVYRGDGYVFEPVFTVPKSPRAGSGEKAGTPTGAIADFKFLASPGNPASFLLCTLDGLIAAWNPETGLPPGGVPPSAHAVIKVKTTDSSSFTGLTAASVDGDEYLYVANFSKQRIDVYSASFKRVDPASLASAEPAGSAAVAPFYDKQVPGNYGPYNVHAIGNDIVVTYAPLDGSAGPGAGYVDIFSATGTLLRRLQHGAWMNAPWGVALAPNDFGDYSHYLLVAQTGLGGPTAGSGTIAAFDLITGKYAGVLKDLSGTTIAIEGLRAIAVGGGVSTGSVDPFGAPAAELYFTAAPNHGKAGLLGYLTAASADLNDGNDQ